MIVHVTRSKLLISRTGGRPTLGAQLILNHLVSFPGNNHWCFMIVCFNSDIKRGSECTRSDFRALILTFLEEHPTVCKPTLAASSRAAWIMKHAWVTHDEQSAVHNCSAIKWIT